MEKQFCPNFGSAISQKIQRKGINIMKYDDGSTKKVIIK